MRGFSACLLLAAASAAVPGMGSSHHVPVWARGGSLFADLVRAEAAEDAAAGIVSNSTPNYFDQVVDHAAPSAGTFRQKYYVDWSNYAGAGAPIFLYIGGEGPAGGTPGGFVATQAAALGAAIFCLEHRWYGESLPGDPTDKAFFMRTLSVEQGLADLAAFATNVSATQLSGAHKWLIVGGSYAGAMASWARLRYPNLFAAAWSSSGVVEAVFNFVEFDRQIVRDISGECADALRHITALAEAAFDDPAERARMYSLFKAPDSLSRVDFLWMMADSGAMGPQYGAKAALCAAVLPVGADPLAQFASWTIGHYGSGFASQCYYSTSCLSDPSQSARWANQRPWVWQCCSELAYWQPGFPGSIRSREITVDYFTGQCQAAFVPGLVANTTGFNAVFGGKDSAVTKVVALAGSNDPWQGACVNASRPDSEVFYAVATCEDGCAHCCDLAGGNAAPIAPLHSLIATQIAAWLA